MTCGTGDISLEPRGGSSSITLGSSVVMTEKVSSILSEIPGVSLSEASLWDWPVMFEVFEVFEVLELQLITFSK